MSFSERLKQSKLCRVAVGISFLCSGLLINVVQAILYYGLRPFSKHLFRKIHYYVNYSLCCQIVFFAQFWGNVKLLLHTDKSEYDKFFGKENGYIIMNHSYEIDWMTGWMLCENIGVLGNTKAFAKKSLMYLPTLGWAWKFGENVFLDRNWEKDKETISRKLEELMRYPDPIWLLITAEGTRFTKEKHEACTEFAKSKGIQPLKHHLLPRTKGFIRSLPHIRSKNMVIYNVTLGFRRGEEPTMKNVLLGKSIIGEMHVERIPVSDVPEDEERCAEWLHELFRKKDRLLDSFIETGNWFETSGVKKKDSFYVRKRIFPVLNTVAWAVTILTLIIYSMVKMLINGNIVLFLISCAIIALLELLMQKLLGETDITKGSSYGTSGPVKMANGTSKKD